MCTKTRLRLVIHLPIQNEFAADVVYHLSCAAHAPDGAPGISSRNIHSFAEAIALKTGISCNAWLRRSWRKRNPRNKPPPDCWTPFWNMVPGKPAPVGIRAALRIPWFFPVAAPTLRSPCGLSGKRIAHPLWARRKTRRTKTFPDARRFGSKRTDQEMKFPGGLLRRRRRPRGCAPG